jgi:hypothetical protein
MIREALVYRRSAFIAGLQKAGFAIVNVLNDPQPGDALVIWNRYGANHETAKRFERAGADVFVVENGYLGKNWLGDRWFAMALNQHAGGGRWNVGADDRWDSLGIELQPWRTGGTDLVILAQRGIGSPEVRSPDGWAEKTQRKIGGRIRVHPGKEPPTISLEDDLRNAVAVVTWASTAALVALVRGIPVWYDYPKWIGALAGRPLQEFGQEPKRSDVDRLQMFQRLIWAMWRAREIEDGTAFEYLLCSDRV